MPKLIGHIAHNFGVCAVSHFAIHFHVGNVSQFSMCKAMWPTLDFAQSQIQRAERFGKGDLLVFGQRLAAKYKHGMLVHRRFNGTRVRFTERPRNIDATGLCGQWCQGFENQCHGVPRLCSVGRSARGFDHLGPFVDLDADERVKLLRRVAHGRQAHIRHTCLDFG